MTTRLFALLLAAVITGCNEADLSANPQRPDLTYTLIEASNAIERRVDPRLIQQHCEKKLPIVEPVRQKWFCRFSFEVGGSRQDCSAILSIQPDDHWSIWKPEFGKLNPSTGETEPNLVCNPSTAAS